MPDYEKPMRRSVHSIETPHLIKGLKKLLMEHCFQHKYIYEHEWHPGDIVISDQVLTLHKRVEWNPEIIAKRVLHRVTFHYDNMIDNYFEKYTKVKETDKLEY